MVDQGNTAILTHEHEVVICTKESSFIYIVLVTVHLLSVIGIQLVVIKLQTLEEINVMICALNAGVHVCPVGGLGIGSSPAAIVEVFDGVTDFAVLGFIGGSRLHGTAAEITEVVFNGVV